MKALGVSIRFLTVVVAGVALIVGTAAHASDFLDTRIALAFAHDNFFLRPGEGSTNSPGIGFGASRQNTQFFDNFNTRFTGFETLSNIALYKRSPSFFENFDAEAALNILVLDLPSGAIQLVDNSSYVKLNYRPRGWGPKEEIALTGFPVSSDRFRLGYNWRVTWAGDAAFGLQQGSGPSLTGRPNAVPGAKIQVTRDRWYAFIGMKTGTLLNASINVQERVYGGLAGFGVDLYRQDRMAFRFEANGGMFGRGVAPSLAYQGIIAPINAAGGSARISFVRGDDIQQSIDIRLYKNDPDVLSRFFTPEKYPGGFSIQAELEGAFLGQTLVNPDVFAQTSLQMAGALALQIRAKYNYWRIFALGMMRTLSFIQFDVPGLPPFYDFARGSKVSPEMWLAIGADHHFPLLHLTTGLTVGAQMPSAVSAPAFDFGGNAPPPGVQGPRTVVVRDANLFAILPANVTITPIISVKGNLKIDISEYFAVIGELFYTWDRNRYTFRDSTASISNPTLEQPHQLGFNAVVQARF